MNEQIVHPGKAILIIFVYVYALYLVLTRSYDNKELKNKAYYFNVE